MAHHLEQKSAYCPGGGGGGAQQINEISVHLAHKEEHFLPLIQVDFPNLFTNKPCMENPKRS